MITAELKQSQERLKNLKANFDEADPDISDVVYLDIKAEEARFRALLREARKEVRCEI